MRRIGILLLAVSQVGATRYVDSGCNVNGNGTAIDCASSGGGNGPWKTMDDARNGWACGDTVNIRGVHSPHGSNHTSTTTDGRYSTFDFIRVDGDCSASPRVIQAYGWTAVGANTQEPVFVEGTASPGAWTVCTWSGSCQSPCTGIPTQAACEGTWYVNASGNQDRSIGAQRPDGRLTRRVTGLASIANQWDSYSPATTGGDLFVYWGTGANAPGGTANPKPYVFYSNTGAGFYLGFSTPAQGMTLQGFTVRCNQAAGIFVRGINNTIRDMRILDSMNPLQDDDYGIQTDGRANGLTITDNDLGYTESEAIHLQAYCAATDCTSAGNPCVTCTGAGTCSACGATVIDISRNYIHDTGDVATMGPALQGTPSGIIAGDHGGGGGNGDYTGSKIKANLIRNTGLGVSCGRGVILENASSGWEISNNIFVHTYGPAIKMEANSGGAGCNDNVIATNIMVDTDYGGSCGEGAASIFMTSGGGTGTLANNKIYNNTLAYGLNMAITESCNNKCTGTLIRNNIMYTPLSLKLVGWTNTDASNVLDYNLISTQGGTAATWLNVNRSCSALSAAGANNIDGCPDPQFNNPASPVFDFKLQLGSPAINTGIPSGSDPDFPAGKTTDILNDLAGIHALPSYGLGEGPVDETGNPLHGPWDIGACEYPARSTPGRAPILSRLVLPEDLVCR